MTPRKTNQRGARWIHRGVGNNTNVSRAPRCPSVFRVSQSLGAELTVDAPMDKQAELCVAEPFARGVPFRWDFGGRGLLISEFPPWFTGVCGRYG
jgi:hypothetical protein